MSIKSMECGWLKYSVHSWEKKFQDIDI